jgi:hypothetical protein
VPRRSWQNKGLIWVTSDGTLFGLDWTYAHHERGPHIWGVKKRWEHVEGRMARYQTVVTVVIANRALFDDRAVVVQSPALYEAV